MSHGGVSFWIATTPETSYPSLEGAISVDVAVVGGGITGITAATLLKNEGKTVALLESKRIVRGATGYTTAKVTAGHGAVYRELISSFGEENARLYAEANQAAIERIAQLAEEGGIDCDFERKTNYVYGETTEEGAALRDEAEAERRIGLPSSWTNDTPLPFAVGGAVRLENQAQFHPRKYLLALAASLPGDGSHVFELTRVLDAREGDPCTIMAEHGTVTARDVVIATQLPILDRGLFFAKAHAHRSYAVAAPLDGAPDPDGMFINAGQPTRSVRTLRDGERVYIQVGGQGHKAGRAGDTPERYDTLEAFLRTHWPAAAPVEYRWSTMDFMPLDRVPYIGRLRRTSDHLFAATGFNKWGMTNGTVAAMLLTDRILGRGNAWAGVFESKRWHVRASLARFVAENTATGLRYVTDRLRRADTRIDDLRPGEGGIVRVRGRKTAVYRDEQGKLHAHSPLCRHLYCLVGWNPAERSWDCPCHGSRYSAEGKVIQGPTTRDLEPRSLSGGSA